VLASRSLVWLAVCAVLLGLSGCGSCKTRGQEPIEYRGGHTIPPDNLVYETSAPFGEYLHFPAGRTYDLMHELAATPYLVASYIAFNRVIEQDDDGNTGNYAESAGNQVVVECQDEERVRVRNDTCADMYLRVVLEANAESLEANHPCL